MNLVERVKAILLTPKTEWAAIEGEPGDPQFLFTNYVAILAAIPAVCRFIGMSVVGLNMPMVGTYRVGVVSGLAGAIVQYILTFVIVYVMALIIDGLAPTFGGIKSQPSALKLAVYSMTPVLARRNLLAHSRPRRTGHPRPLWPLHLLARRADPDEDAGGQVDRLHGRGGGVRHRHLRGVRRDRRRNRVIAGSPGRERGGRRHA
jgi:hypothetical protein